ncbi:iron-containing redox enzyme family protein [Xylella fastidiosa]|uniref:iron-containing redox enzyme family protein n=1 Tax=Xylella fastidiosa TaxID=2371 RepID=UPI001F34E2A8|nr:iron-containing redox enzyme family protein [Xylella fastidiosa]WNY20322.1 iron-containing redox enzyme family protein [Xylella fastidiosa]WNY22613.1 iron-containing redox enzyme family protein [Xylella fastidiosa]
MTLFPHKESCMFIEATVKPVHTADTPPITSLEGLKRHLDDVWRDLFRISSFLRAIQDGEVTKSLYALYLLETYHYTKHNARNQALVGVRYGDDHLYQKFCFKHAAEEVGHEMMALHDLKNLGLGAIDFEIPDPLPATTTLTAYLYWIAYQGNPLQRLGYSFWAEACYEYVLPMMAKVKEKLQLSTNQMTFFVSHADIDEEHSRIVNDMITRKCRVPADWQAIAEVMETSLRLTGKMMDEVYVEHHRLIAERAGRATFLLTLKS